MTLLAQHSLLEISVLAALGVVIGWLLLRTHRQLSRRNRGSAPVVQVARPVVHDRGHHLDSPPEVLRWEVEMHETARELSAQLDSKMGALQVLIADADRAAARLEAAVADVQSPKPLATASADAEPATQAEALRSPEHPAAPESQREKVPSGPSVRREPEAVYRLADQGLSPTLIAKQLGAPVGEIELILGLRAKG